MWAAASGLSLVRLLACVSVCRVSVYKRGLGWGRWQLCGLRQGLIGSDRHTPHRCGFHVCPLVTPRNYSAFSFSTYASLQKSDGRCENNLSEAKFAKFANREVCAWQLKTVLQQRYASQPNLGSLDPGFKYNIYRSLHPCFCGTAS